MNDSHFTARVTVLASLFITAPLAHAQPGPDKVGEPRDKPPAPLKLQPSATPAASTPAPAIANKQSNARSLVERDGAGKLKRLTTSPASAAVVRLPLSAATAEAVTNIQQGEASSWDAWVQANLVKLMDTAEELAAQEQVQQQTDAPKAAREKEYLDAKAEADAKASANDKIEAEGKAKREVNEEATKKLGEGQVKPTPSKAQPTAKSKLEELGALLAEAPQQTADGNAAQPPRINRGLAHQFTGVLSPDENLAMQEIIREHSDASVAQRIADSKASGKEMTVAEATSRELLEGVGSEFKRAFDRTVGHAAKMYDTSGDKLGLTAAQSSELLPITGPSFEKSLEKATPTERVRMFSKMYQLLTPQQREALLKEIK